MTDLKDSFENRKHTSTLRVLVMGAGVMGGKHAQALLEVSEKLLKPHHGVTLEVCAVDRRDVALPADVKKFGTLEEALAVFTPDVAVMAFNDDQHMDAFKTLFAACPDLKAVLSEKPLTEFLSQAREIEPELRKRYLSMNTIINFSPVFDRLKEVLPELEKSRGALTPIGFEAIWGKNRMSDTRPSIGIPSESVHALSVVSDMFAQDQLRMESGGAIKGYLSSGAQDVIYEMDAVFRSGKTGLPMKFHASYIFPEQHRKVTAYYKAADGNVIAVELDFDVKKDGKNLDRLRLHTIDQKTGALVTLHDEYPERVENGAAAGLLKNDKLTAWNALSMVDFLTPAARRDPALSARLSNLDAAIQVQGEVEQISDANPRLAVTNADADGADLHRPKYASIADAAPAERLARLAGIAPAVRTSEVKLKP